MKTALKSAITLAELFNSVTDLIKIVLLMIVIYKIESFGSAFVSYTTGAKDAVVGASEVTVDKAVAGYEALITEKDSLKESVLNLQKKLSD